MNSEVQPLITESASGAQPPVISAQPARPSRVRRLVFAPVTFVLGMALCQSVFGSLAVIGWTYRLMQRSVVKYWWDQSRLASGVAGFHSFLASDSRTRDHLHWPNWILQQNFREAIRRDPREGLPRHRLTVVKALGSSFWANVRIGVPGIFNTWVLTLPGCVLGLFAWYAGWNNSFNKGYEQAWIGPAVGLLGIALFIAALLYVPMAQARQAITGDWRRFYDFRLVWTLVRRRWPACLGLAMLYSLVSIPILVLGALPMSFPQMNPAMIDFTDQQVIRYLSRYFFWAAAFTFPAFVVVRLVAARIYGSTLLKAVQSGAIGEDALSEEEWHALHRLDLIRVQPDRQRHPVLRVIAWAGTRAGRMTFGILTALVWFTLVSQIYILHFFNYRGAPGWLNQPLVQLPWFRHLPERLENPLGQLFIAVAIVFVAWRLRKLAKWVQSLRRK